MLVIGVLCSTDHARGWSGLRSVAHRTRLIRWGPAGASFSRQPAACRQVSLANAMGDQTRCRADTSISDSLPALIAGRVAFRMWHWAMRRCLHRDRAVDALGSQGDDESPGSRRKSALTSQGQLAEGRARIPSHLTIQTTSPRMYGLVTRRPGKGSFQAVQVVACSRGDQSNPYPRM